MLGRYLHHIITGKLSRIAGSKYFKTLAIISYFHEKIGNFLFGFEQRVAYFYLLFSYPITISLIVLIIFIDLA